MSARDDGGPAFPVDVQLSDMRLSTASHGMTLRDYFAAKAMQIMWDAYDKGYCGLNDKGDPNTKTIAQGAYEMADAMLAERIK